jgi:hypothetical protein
MLLSVKIAVVSGIGPRWAARSRSRQRAKAQPA